MVSVIIPCYNISRYISSTINSILVQTDKNWEIIAIDDGSTDNTFEILMEYAQQYSQIHVYHQDNKGVSAARNLGLKHAKGDWIYFLDGDDIVESELVHCLNSQDNDVEFTAFDFLMENNGCINKYHTIPSCDNILNMFLTNKLTICMCSFALRRDLIVTNNLSFDINTFYGEDREFIANALSYHPKTVIINKPLFHYQLREGSAMATREYNVKRYSSILASERIYKKLIGCPEERKALSNLCFTIIRHYKMIREFDQIDENLSKCIYKYIYKYLKPIKWFGFGRIELYTFVASLCCHNKSLFNIFIKIL